MGWGRPVMRMKSLACVLLIAGATGCQQAGAMMYFLGVGQYKRVPAEYKLPKAPTLILVDDEQNLVHPSTAREALVESLAAELRQRRLVDRITTSEELAQLRLTYTDLHDRGAREVGQLAGADTVLWIQITRFGLPDDLERVMSEVPFGATVKVLNALAESRDEVRLWPEQREGKYVEVTLSPHDLRRSRDLSHAHQTMAVELAEEIGKLFYAHTVEEN